jgi:hypothetical protein
MLEEATLFWILVTFSPTVVLMCVFYPTIVSATGKFLGIGDEDAPRLIWLRIVGVIVGIITTVVPLLHWWLG